MSNKKTHTHPYTIVATFIIWIFNCCRPGLQFHHVDLNNIVPNPLTIGHLSSSPTFKATPPRVKMQCFPPLISRKLKLNINQRVRPTWPRISRLKITKVRLHLHELIRRWSLLQGQRTHASSGTKGCTITTVKSTIANALKILEDRARKGKRKRLVCLTFSFNERLDMMSKKWPKEVSKAAPKKHKENNHNICGPVVFKHLNMG